VVPLALKTRGLQLTRTARLIRQWRIRPDSACFQMEFLPKPRRDLVLILHVRFRLTPFFGAGG
jgi:hypothetical protein